MSEESNRDVLGDEMYELWKKVCDKRDEEIKNGTYEPCCDENNPCCCNTFSPYMASPEDVSNFIKYQNSKRTKKQKRRTKYLSYKYKFEDWIDKIKEYFNNFKIKL